MAGGGRLEDLRQPEVGQLGRAADEEDVVRLDVAMLDADQAAAFSGRVARLVEEIGRLGQLAHEAEQLVARQASRAGAEPVQEALVAQGHGDHEAIVHMDGELDVEQVGMADIADDLQRPQFRPGLVGVEADELQGHADTAGRDRLPDLAEPATPEPPDERIAGDGLDTGFQVEGHRGTPESCRACSARHLRSDPMS